MKVAPVRGALEAHEESRQLRAPVMWGIIWGGIQAVSPLAFWWLETATVYALSLVLIASVYIGFAVADGRWLVIAFETNVAAIFVIIAAAAVTQASRSWRVFSSTAYGHARALTSARARTAARITVERPVPARLQASLVVETLLVETSSTFD
jgi:hypothetical protein